MSETKLKFGDPVIGISASDDNPHKRGYFVRRFYRQAVVNRGWTIEATDGNGDFWTCAESNIQPDPTRHDPQRQRLVDALKAAQWCSFNDSDHGTVVFCPECRNDKSVGHHAECSIGILLNEVAE